MSLYSRRGSNAYFAVSVRPRLIADRVECQPRNFAQTMSSDTASPSSRPIQFERQHSPSPSIGMRSRFRRERAKRQVASASAPLPKDARSSRAPARMKARKSRQILINRVLRDGRSRLPTRDGRCPSPGDVHARGPLHRYLPSFIRPRAQGTLFLECRRAGSRDKNRCPPQPRVRVGKERDVGPFARTGLRRSIARTLHGCLHASASACAARAPMRFRRSQRPG